MKKYSLLNNIVFLMRKSWQIDKTLLLVTIFQIPIIVLMPLLATYLSKHVVALVTQNVSIHTFIINVVALSSAMLFLYLTNNYISTKIQWGSFENRFKYIDIYNQKAMTMDYEVLETPDVQNKSQKALNTILGDSGGTQQIFSQIISIASNIIGLITYSIILMSFNLWIVLLLFVMTIITYFFTKANNIWMYKNQNKWIPIDRKIDYIRRISGHFEMAKDIRLFGMSSWFNNLFNFFVCERKCWWKRSEKRYFVTDVVVAVMNFVRDGLAYIILIYQATNGSLNAADFVLYFSLIAQYSGWLMGIIQSYSVLHTTSLQFCNLREFLDMEDKFNHGNGADLPKTAPEIVLRNVSFRYPNSENDTLKNINVSIKKGEKIAIVGLNGAGKTTLVKLLCGLYSPTSGEILVDGKSIFEYNIEQYYSILSVVFQDIILMPASIAKNIALCEEENINKSKLERVLKLSGLYDKVNSLEEKENTLLLKSIHENATDFSGGEKQKLALARALYKSGSIIILDEPTAALDPIAENEMYQKYNELTKSATSVFISHRLSSTRFCDKILFLENGKIVEQGSHYDLMAMKGKYAELFEIQSHYYNEGGKTDEKIEK